MIDRSCVAESDLPTRESAGTNGEMPPRPCGPWHCAQANWTKSCATAAPAGLTDVEVAGVVPPATDTVDGPRGQCPAAKPTMAATATSAARTAHPTTSAALRNGT